MYYYIKNFLKLEAASGMIIMVATVLALLCANSPFSHVYDALLQTPVIIQIGGLKLAKPLLLWINDGLMAIFFLLVGLELKREMIDGHLANIAKVILPGGAAIGGMIVPALIYITINWGDTAALNGWAIPTATDIAFALSVLALVGSGISASLKIFLMALAIIDDIGAIIIIAVFYSGSLSLFSLSIAFFALLVLSGLRLFKVQRIAAYMIVGVILWVSVLKSGVHATLAGVILAFFIPYKNSPDSTRSPLEKLEHDLHSWTAYGILPLFAFANAGVALTGLSLDTVFAPVPLGIMLGLFLGKQIGVFSFTWIMVKTGIGKLPERISWLQLYGISVLCGIGFTMSLFIGSLAFEQGGPDYAVADRLGILLGSLFSAIVGYLLLKSQAKRH